MNSSDIAVNYDQIIHRVAAACERAGRRPEDVRVIGVTKTKPAATIRAAREAGITDVGENYVQEIVEKHAELGEMVRWHFIGHLQRNKVRAIAPFVAMIHGVDSERLGEEIDRQAARLGRRVPVLVQVNTSGEESKFGVPPEEARPLAEALARMPNLELAGMMTIAAFLDDQELVYRFAMRPEVVAGLLPAVQANPDGDTLLQADAGAALQLENYALLGPSAWLDVAWL